MKKIKVSKVGNGKVVLIAGGGKVYTDIAARFCHTNKELDDILASDYDKNIVNNIISSGHLAATEFDYFLFGIEGYARVTEVQLVRKRLASYLITSGRDDRNGKREFDIILPQNIMSFNTSIQIPASIVTVDGKSIYELTNHEKNPVVKLNLNIVDLLSFIEQWYNNGVEAGLPEEDLRYGKPQATAFKAIIGMNAHSLLDWFGIRCCLNAQTEIRDLANKMQKLCKESAPDLFKDSGARCKLLGYCPENDRQNKSCKKITKDKALEIIKNAKY